MSIVAKWSLISATAELLLWPPNMLGRYIFALWFASFMAALWNRADHIYFHAVVCSFFFFSSPNLSRSRLDVCHTSTHGVALVRI